MIVDEQHDLDKAKENVYILERGLLKMLTTWVLETRIKLVLICFNKATKIYRKFCNFFCSFCQMVCKEYKKTNWIRKCMKNNKSVIGKYKIYSRDLWKA